jgi:hypothetical protein
MQPVRNMAGYFAKYVGKAEDREICRDHIPGRWWGFCNSHNVPWGKRVSLELPVRMRIYAQRVARKIRQKRADAAKFNAVCRAAHLVNVDGPNRGRPYDFVSQFSITLGKWHREPPGFNAPFYMAQSVGKRFGKYKLPSALKTSAVRLTGPGSLQLAKRILEYAADRYRDFLETSPF